ncbi:hypothetical protein LIER_10392 [Lithospermum erythrorhizon]|uniref:Uncharacterized protein n=1 Tax=Lithospermum erythrorhizon TaxID=34254 RepID=A0AAV3PP38_LITER
MYPFGPGFPSGSGGYDRFNYMPVPTVLQNPWYYPQMVGAQGSQMLYHDATMMVGAQGSQMHYGSSSTRVDSYGN